MIFPISSSPWLGTQSAMFFIFFCRILWESPATVVCVVDADESSSEELVYYDGFLPCGFFCKRWFSLSLSHSWMIHCETNEWEQVGWRHCKMWTSLLSEKTHRWAPSSCHGLAAKAQQRTDRHLLMCLLVAAAPEHVNCAGPVHTRHRQAPWKLNGICLACHLCHCAVQLRCLQSYRRRTKWSATNSSSGPGLGCFWILNRLTYLPSCRSTFSLVMHYGPVNWICSLLFHPFIACLPSKVDMRSSYPSISCEQDHGDVGSNLSYIDCFKKAENRKKAYTVGLCAFWQSTLVWRGAFNETNFSFLLRPKVPHHLLMHYW